MARTQQKQKILRRYGKNTQKHYAKKDLSDPANHDGVIAHPDPHILQCEVNLALESITTNKARGGDGITVELFQILKDNAVKCCTQYVRECFAYVLFQEFYSFRSYVQIFKLF